MAERIPSSAIGRARERLRNELVVDKGGKSRLGETYPAGGSIDASGSRITGDLMNYGRRRPKQGAAHIDDGRRAP